MTGLCVSGNPVSAGDVSIKVTEHCPHLLWRRSRKHARSANLLPTKQALVTHTVSLNWCTFDFEVSLLI